MGAKTYSYSEHDLTLEQPCGTVHSYEQHGEDMVVSPHKESFLSADAAFMARVITLGPGLMALYLCVDCGGSKTSAVIADAEGNIVGRAVGGPSNFAYLTVEAFSLAVGGAVSNALRTCVSPPAIDPVPLPLAQGFAAAWFGVSGVDSPSAIATITPVLSSLLGIPEGPRLLIGNDTQLLAAPLQTLPDVATAVTVVSGTGAIAVSFEKVDGHLRELGRVGGWGWILGDEGGGFHVGREVVRQLLTENDAASVAASPPAPTKLRAKVLENFGVSTVPDILQIVHQIEQPAHLDAAREKRLSSLTPFVFEAAFADDDPLALNVLRTCASQLAAEIAILVGDRDELRPRLVKAQESVISFGGSLAGIERYRQMILDDLAGRGHVFKHVEFVDDAAAVGAYGLAKAFRV